VREILRRGLLGRLPAVDLVIRARRGAYAARFTVLRDELADGTSKLSP
jgi:RNase P protein component